MRTTKYRSPNTLLRLQKQSDTLSLKSLLRLEPSKDFKGSLVMRSSGFLLVDGHCAPTDPSLTLSCRLCAAAYPPHQHTGVGKGFSGQPKYLCPKSQRIVLSKKASQPDPADHQCDPCLLPMGFLLGMGLQELVPAGCFTVSQQQAG